MTDKIPLAELISTDTQEYVYGVDHLFSNLYRTNMFTNVRGKCMNCCRECIKNSNKYKLKNDEHIVHLDRCDLCKYTDSYPVIAIITHIVVIDDDRLCLKIGNKYCDIVCTTGDNSPHNIMLTDKLVEYNVVEKDMSKRKNVMHFSIINISDNYMDVIKLSFKYNKNIYDLLLLSNKSNRCLFF